jgi:quercetin dioxygenase-like cupin family protein
MRTSLAKFEGERAMDQKAFEAELSRGGYTQFETKVIEPRPANSAHTHDYIIRGLVLDGIFIVTEGDKPTTYRAGDTFQVAAGQPHTPLLFGRMLFAELGRIVSRE